MNTSSRLGRPTATLLALSTGVPACVAPQTQDGRALGSGADAGKGTDAADAGFAEDEPPAPPPMVWDDRPAPPVEALPCQPDPCAGQPFAPCRQGRCDAETGECRERVAPDGAGCSDGDPVTLGDRCVEGRCEGDRDLPRVVGFAEPTGRLLRLAPGAGGTVLGQDTGVEVPAGERVRLGDQLVVLVRQTGSARWEHTDAVVLDPHAGTVTEAGGVAGSLTVLSAVPGRRSLVVVQRIDRVEHLARLDLDPFAVEDLGPIGGPGAFADVDGYGTLRPIVASDGATAVTLDGLEGDAGPVDVIAVVVAGPDAGHRRTAASLPPVLPVEVRMVGGRWAIVVSKAESDSTSVRCTVVDLTGRQGAADLGGCGTGWWYDTAGTVELTTPESGDWILVGGEQPGLLRLGDDGPSDRFDLAHEPVAAAFEPRRSSLLTIDAAGAVREVPLGDGAPGPARPVGVLESPDPGPVDVLGASRDANALIVRIPKDRLALVPLTGGEARPIASPGHAFAALAADGDAAWFVRRSDGSPAGAPAVLRVDLARPDAAQPVDLDVPAADFPAPAILGLDGTRGGDFAVVEDARGGRVVRNGPEGAEELLGSVRSRPLVPPTGGLVVARLVDTGAFVAVDPAGDAPRWSQRSARVDGSDGPGGLPLSEPVAVEQPRGVRERFVSPGGRWAVWRTAEPQPAARDAFDLAPADGSWEGRTWEVAAPFPARCGERPFTLPVGFASDDALWVRRICGVTPRSGQGWALIPLDVEELGTGVIRGPLPAVSTWGVDVGIAPDGSLLQSRAGRPDLAEPPGVALFAIRIGADGHPFEQRLSPFAEHEPPSSLLVLQMATDGRIAYLFRYGGTGVRLVHLDGRNAEGAPWLRPPDGSRAFGVRDFGPDGLVLADVTVDEPDVYVLSDDGATIRRLTPADGHAERVAAWSRDGRYVIHEGQSGAWSGVRASALDGSGEVPYRLLDLPGHRVTFLGEVDRPR